MRMLHVPGSSNIAKAGYDQDTKTFGVEFKSGTTYHYADVPSSKYEAFLIAPSAGKYFIGNIKNEHPFTKIDPPAKEKATADQECGAA